MAKGRDLKPHIGIFGRRNCGKSSFVNVLVDQDIAIVSDFAGTTTDPVKKSLEIFGIGPAIIIDTAGIDDTGELGEKRVKKSMDVIKSIDAAILMITENTFGSFEMDLIAEFNSYNVPFVIVHNKSDIEEVKEQTVSVIRCFTKSSISDFCALNKDNLEPLIDEIKLIIPETAYTKPSLFGGLVKKGDVVLLITPIDSEAPEGRMILPQVMAIRDVLDNDCICIVVKETEVEAFLKKGIKPDLVVTDSQAFETIDPIIPKDIPLTGFSVVFARLKGNFDKFLEGTPHISNLKDGDRVLVLESCTHRVSCEDIGRYKIPNWIKAYTGKDIEFDIVSGLNNITRDITDYSLLVQCGGCMITKKQVLNRLKPAIDINIPVTNYGMAIAYMHKAYDRAVAPFLKVNEEVEV